ncbi:MAG: nucleotidyl transferase AbiEii/AbiGii toxin family protein [Oscillospiraceae bacterium]|nr:nucleotidyl transferase AbiEii/AbiGii toxin family protein [Oscillospiraceae bacterium]
MIKTETFTIEHIRAIQHRSKRDPELIERMIFAFGLIEAIARSGLPFIFKGGTSLILLMDRPRRFSTDIDIVVKPNTDVDEYLEAAAKIWPFVKNVEHIRNATSNIEKRHFKFSYKSPLTEKDRTILLDIVFEDNPYSTTVEKSIENELLLTEPPTVAVRIPNANGIVADKLTAFAPHTTGIPYNNDKEMEIIKQLYDIAALMEFIDDFAEVKSNYHSIVLNEFEYRGIDARPEDALWDTIRATACIAGRGLLYPDEYNLLKKGITNIRNHIFSESFNGEVALQRACMVMYLASAVLTNQTDLPVFKEDDFYISAEVRSEEYNKLAYIKKMDMLAYKHLVEAVKMLMST